MEMLNEARCSQQRHPCKSRLKSEEIPAYGWLGAFLLEFHGFLSIAWWAEAYTQKTVMWSCVVVLRHNSDVGQAEHSINDDVINFYATLHRVAPTSSIGRLDWNCELSWMIFALTELWKPYNIAHAMIILYGLGLEVYGLLRQARMYRSFSVTHFSLHSTTTL